MRLLLRLLASLCLALCLGTTAKAEIYDFTASGFINGGMTVGLHDYTFSCRIFIPEGLTQVKGVLLMSNGTGEDTRAVVCYPFYQEFCRANEFAIIGTNSVNIRNSYNSGEGTAYNLNQVLTAAAAASGRANLINAPLLLTGMSMGGYSSSDIAMDIPTRILGFVAHKGTTALWSAASTNLKEVPGIIVPGERDSVVDPNEMNTAYLAWRTYGAPRTALAVAWNEDHDMGKTIGIDFGLASMTEMFKVRHPGGYPSTTPNTPLTLTSVPLANGWLAQRPEFANASDVLVPTVRPTWPQIAAYSSYSGGGTQPSWLLNEHAALIYRAFLNTSSSYVDRREAPRNNHLQIESPARFQRFHPGEPVKVIVDPRDWNNVTQVSLLLDGVSQGTRTDGDWRWTLTNVSTGYHTLVAVATDASGNSESTLLSFSVIPEPTTFATWTGGAGTTNVGTAANWASNTVPSDSVYTTAKFDGAAANNVYSISNSSLSVNPDYHGVRFQSAPGANGFTFTGWRRMRIGYAGIRNDDDSTQTFSPGEIWLDAAQTWHAAAGDINVTCNLRLGSTSESGRPSYATFSDLTLRADSGRTLTLGGIVSNYGNLIKEGAGTALLNGANTFGDSANYWEPALNETLRVQEGTLRVGTSGTLGATTNRVYVAPGATLDLNGTAQTVAYINGGGTIALGTGGKLTLNNTFSYTNLGNMSTTLDYRGSLTGGTSGNDALVLNNLSSTRTLKLSGTSTFSGLTRLSAGYLYVASNDALGATGTGNETVTSASTRVYVSGTGLTVPEDLTFNNASNEIPLWNDASSTGTNTLSGKISVATSASGGSNIDSRLLNNAPSSTLRLSGTLTGQENTGSARLMLEGVDTATVDVTGLIINPTGGATTSLYLRRYPSATGNPTFRLANQNTFTGGVTFMNGRLLIATDAPSGAAGALGNSTGSVTLGTSWGTSASDDITLVTEGAVSVGRALLANNYNTSGNITLGGSTAHSSSFTGTITIGGSRDLRLTAATGGSVDISGRIDDSTNTATLTKVGAGTVSLSRATGNTYDGATTVSEGTLLASNTSGSATGTGAVTVAASARLGGTGIISGNVTLQNNARLAFDATTAPGSHDKLELSGSLTFGTDCVVDIGTQPWGTPATGTYTLLTAGSISGTAPTVSLPSGWSGSTSISGNNLLLTVTALPATPTQPTDLTSNAVGQTTASLRWTDLASGETGYVVERSTTSGSGFTRIATLAANSTSYDDTSLTQATTYYYRVYAYNTGGPSTLTPELAVTTLQPPPSAPSALSATPFSATRIDLSWTDNASNESGYRIERSTTSGSGFSQVGTAAADATSFSDTGLSGETTYYYRVYAYNTGGNSAYTAEASAATHSANLPEPPTGLVASTISATQINLTWTDIATNEASYKVERSTTSGSGFAEIASLAANSTSHSDTSAAAATTYYYRVRAQNVNGYSAYTPEASATTLGTTSRTWDGQTDGTWATAANWDGDTTIPAFGDNVSFPDVTNQTITLGANRTVGTLTFNAADAYTINSGANLTVNGTLANQGAGSLTVNAPLILGSNNTVSASGNGIITLAGALTAYNPTFSAATTTPTLNINGNNLSTLTGRITIDGVKTSFAANAFPDGTSFLLTRTSGTGQPQLGASGSRNVGAIDLGSVNVSRWIYASNATLTLNGVISNGNASSNVEFVGFNAATVISIREANTFVASLVRINADANGSRFLLGNSAALGASANPVRLGWSTSEDRQTIILTDGAVTIPQSITVQHANFDNGGTGVSRPVLGGTGAYASTFSGALSLDHGTVTGTPTLVLRQENSNGTVTFSGVISVASGDTWAILKDGSGTVALSGANTYNGGTTVSAGTLLVNNTSGSGTGTGAVTVAASARLGGTGTISGAVTLQDSARLALTLSTVAASHDRLDISGSLALGSSTTVDIATNGSSVATGTYTLLRAAGGITGTLPALSLPTGYTGTLEISGNDLLLNLTAVPVSFSSWAASYGLSDQSATVTADPDADGLSNLLEYAFNTNPTSAASAQRPTSANASGRLQTVFTRDTQASDLTYTVEASSDAVTWTAVASGVGGASLTGSAFSISETGTGRYRSVTVVDSTEMAAGTPRFLRVRVTGP